MGVWFSDMIDTLFKDADALATELSTSEDACTVELRRRIAESDMSGTMEAIKARFPDQPAAGLAFIAIRMRKSLRMLMAAKALAQ